MRCKAQNNENDKLFSILVVLALSSSTSPSVPSFASQQNITPIQRLASSAHHRGLNSDIPSNGLDHDKDLMNSIRFVRALDKEPNQPRKVPSLPSSCPLTLSGNVNLPHRLPRSPYSFKGKVTFDIGVTFTGVASPVQCCSTRVILSPQPEIVAGQYNYNPPLKIPSQIQSLFLSLSGYSRIPPVRLIYSMPESRPIKGDYDPSCRRSTSPADTDNISEGRATTVELGEWSIICYLHLSQITPPCLCILIFVDRRYTRFDDDYFR